MTARLILKADAPREEWLHVRNTGIGGSDAGVIMGLNPYRSVWDLYMEKTGEKEPDDLSNNEAVYWGTVLEEPVARKFAEETGKKITRRGTLRREDYPFMIANVDRMIVGENAGLEIKTTSAFNGKAWDGDEIPDSYYCQCLHYMAVTGCERWYIAALIGGQKFVWKEIPRNEDDIKLLIQKEREFWGRVSAKIPPEIDASDGCTEALRGRFKGNPGSMIELTDDAKPFLEMLDNAKQMAKEAKDQETLAKNALMSMMGDAETATIGDRKITWKAQAGRESISLSEVKKKDMASYEALKAAGLIKQGAPMRAFRVK